MSVVRTALLEAITKLSQFHPQMRLAQLICNLADRTEDTVWYAEDEELLEHARSWIEYQEQQARGETAQVPSNSKP